MLHYHYIINNIGFDDDYFNLIVNTLDINNILKKYPQELSGGEKQRIAIMRAMIIKPDILFADDPTGNLDEYNSNNIVKLLEIH